jgi:hypothetical protein
MFVVIKILANAQVFRQATWLRSRSIIRDEAQTYYAIAFRACRPQISAARKDRVR